MIALLMDLEFLEQANSSAVVTIMIIEKNDSYLEDEIMFQLQEPAPLIGENPLNDVLDLQV